MEIRQCFLVKNECYTKNQYQRGLPSEQQDSRYRQYYEEGPKGIVVHSTGINNPWLQRYVQPDDGILGTNRYGNSWNNPGIAACVNAFIGKVDDGGTAIYQTLPWEYRPWGVGSGRKGSYNDSHIQFEICEDNHSDEGYCRECFELAAQLCAYLCKEYGIPVSGIVSHHEAYKAGYGSGHNDPDNWWPRFGLSMDGLRKRVEALLDGGQGEVPEPAEKPVYRVRKAWEDKASQIGAYTVLENAIRACPSGYSVFDPDGREVYTVKGGRLAPAQHYDAADKGTYRVTARGGLHLRTGPSTLEGSLEILPEAAEVRCYGYSTDGWLCIVSPSGNIGYASGEYLRKEGGA